MGGVRRLRSGRPGGLIEEDGGHVGSAVGLFGDAVEGMSQDEPGIWSAQSQGAEDAHEDFSGFRAAHGLGTKTELAGDDGSPQVPFGGIVFRRDQRVIRPVQAHAKQKSLTQAYPPTQ